MEVIAVLLLFIVMIVGMSLMDKIPEKKKKKDK
jgi:hypothetical protein